MEVIKQLLGRLHPIIVHLPIGFIILGLSLQWYDRKRKEYKKFIPLVFFWGGISAVMACITGYLQYIGEGYAFDTVKWHLWSGILTALFSFLMFAILKQMKAVIFLAKMPMVTLTLMLFLLISFTGHQGGTITHGEDYLVEPLPNSVKAALGFEIFEEKEIALTNENWEDAQLYEGVIAPILNNNCVSCHNRKKAKGELLLHTEEGILKGGENGEVIIAKSASGSELFIRINLPMENDDHMPPEGKKQPSKEEIKLIGAWIDTGHPFAGTIKEIGLEKELFLSFFPIIEDNDYPDFEISEAAQDSIKVIKNSGVHVDLINKTSNFLSVSSINKPSFTDVDFETLQPIKKQIARLDLSGTEITDIIFEKLATLPNLTVLKLDHTAITGKNIHLLSSLENLKSINLTATQFDQQNLRALSDFKKLNKVYLYNTNVNSKGFKTLRDGQINIDYGDYKLPPIPSDSIVY